jgi:putative addiction module killer protein
MRIRRSDVYKNWHKKLSDPRARYRISIRIKRLGEGNPGDVKPVGEGVSEMRIDYGPGYRVYYKTTSGCQNAGKEIIILLCGGDKSTQDDDIKRAKKIAAAYKPDEEE